MEAHFNRVLEQFGTHEAFAHFQGCAAHIAFYSMPDFQKYSPISQKYMKM
jgi:hypothetical protein